MFNIYIYIFLIDIDISPETMFRTAPHFGSPSTIQIIQAGPESAERAKPESEDMLCVEMCRDVGCICLYM